MIKKNKGYKFRLKPTKEQEEYFSKCFGCTRKLYNIYVDLLYQYLESQNYENGFIKGFTFPTPAKFKEQYPYFKEIDSLALANTQLDFQGAISKFNKECDKKTYNKSAIKKSKTINKLLTFRDLKGIPSFKSKKNKLQSFTTNNQHGTIEIVDNHVRIPKLKTSIKYVNHRKIPQEYTLKSATISRNHGKYYISFTMEYYVEEVKVKPKSFLGLDYSQTNFYVSSEDEKANYPHYYKQLENKIIIEQRKLSHMVLKSNNWYKQKEKISKLQEKIANQRLDWLHKKSYELAENWDVVVFENIDLRNMAQLLHLGKNLHDNGFGMFRNFVNYKLCDRGKYFVKVDKWFPSSKKCHCCGRIKEDLGLNDRVWVCECGSVNDRDYNASLNIRDEGKRMLGVAV